MRTKILLASGLVVAFVLGVMANGIYSNTTRAFNPAEDPQTQAPAPVIARTHFVQPARTPYTPATYTANTRPATVPVSTRKTRSLEKEALIVGGSAGAGAAIGAIAGGGKGAGIGALSGGIAGLVYDLATRHK